MTNSEPLKIDDSYFTIVFWDWKNNLAYIKYYFIDSVNREIIETDNKLKIKELFIIASEYCRTQGLTLHSY